MDKTIFSDINISQLPISSDRLRKFAPNGLQSKGNQLSKILQFDRFGLARSIV